MSANKLLYICRLAHHDFEVYLLRWLRGDSPVRVLHEMNDALMRWTQSACMLQPLSANIESVLIRSLTAFREMQAGRLRTDRLAQQWAARLNVWLGQLTRELSRMSFSGRLPEPPELLGRLVERLNEPVEEKIPKQGVKKTDDFEAIKHEKPSQTELHLLKSIVLNPDDLDHPEMVDQVIEKEMDDLVTIQSALFSSFEKHQEKYHFKLKRTKKNKNIEGILKSRKRTIRASSSSKSKKVSFLHLGQHELPVVNTEDILDKTYLDAQQINQELNQVLMAYLKEWHWATRVEWPVHTTTRFLIVKEVIQDVVARAVACSQALGYVLPQKINLQGGVLTTPANQWGDTDCWVRLNLKVPEPNWDAVVQWADSRRASALTVLENHNTKSQALSWLGTASGFGAAFGLGQTLTLPSLRRARTQLKLLGGHLESAVLTQPWTLSWTVRWAANTLPSHLLHVQVPQEHRVWLIHEQQGATDVLVWGVKCCAETDGGHAMPNWQQGLRTGLMLKGWRDVLTVSPDSGMVNLAGLIALAWIEERWLPVFDYPPGLKEVSETLSIFTTL